MSQFRVENCNQISYIAYNRGIAGGYRNPPHSNHGYYSVVLHHFYIIIPLVEVNIAKYLPSCYTLKEETYPGRILRRKKKCCCREKRTGTFQNVHRKTILAQNHRY